MSPEPEKADHLAEAAAIKKDLGVFLKEHGSLLEELAKTLRLIDIRVRIVAGSPGDEGIIPTKPKNLGIVVGELIEYISSAAGLGRLHIPSDDITPFNLLAEKMLSIGRQRPMSVSEALLSSAGSIRDYAERGLLQDKIKITSEISNLFKDDNNPFDRAIFNFFSKPILFIFKRLRDEYRWERATGIREGFFDKLRTFSGKVTTPEVELGAKFVAIVEKLQESGSDLRFIDEAHKKARAYFDHVDLAKKEGVKHSQAQVSSRRAHTFQDKLAEEQSRLGGRKDPGR